MALSFPFSTCAIQGLTEMKRKAFPHYTVVILSVVVIVGLYLYSAKQHPLLLNQHNLHDTSDVQELFSHLREYATLRGIAASSHALAVRSVRINNHAVFVAFPYRVNAYAGDTHELILEKGVFRFVVFFSPFTILITFSNSIHI